MRRYYTLLVKELTDEWQPRWVIEFGDYDRETVEDELQTVMDSYDRKRRDLKIIATSDKQEDIDAKVAELNARLKGGA